MQIKMILVGPGIDDTMPRDDEHHHNGRRMTFPKPGEVFHYASRATWPEMSKFPGEYGLLVMDDWFYTVQKEAPPEGPIPEELKIEPGENIARDLQSRFGRYGLLRIAGESPTPAELVLAKRSRQKWAFEMMERDKMSVEMGRAGHKGYSPTPGRVAELLRQEYKVTSLTLTHMDSAPQQPRQAAGPALMANEDTPCPMCSVPIAATARKCRHCQEGFGMPVLEYITRPLTSDLEEETPSIPAPVEEVPGVAVQSSRSKQHRSA